MKDTVNQVVINCSYAKGMPDGNTTLRDDLGLDSLKLVELIVALEEAFDVEFAESDLDPENFFTVSDLYRLMEHYVG